MTDLVSDISEIPLFDGLTPAQLAELAAGAEEVDIEPGTVYFAEGEPAEHWWVLLDGVLDLVRHVGREDVVVGRMDVPGRWAGGMQAWDPHGTYLATGRGAVPGRALRVASPRPAREGHGLVPARHAPDQRPLRHGSVDRVERAPA